MSDMTADQRTITVDLAIWAEPKITTDWYDDVGPSWAVPLFGIGVCRIEHYFHIAKIVVLDPATDKTTDYIIPVPQLEFKEACVYLGKWMDGILQTGKGLQIISQSREEGLIAVTLRGEEDANDSDFDPVTLYASNAGELHKGVADLIAKVRT